MMSTEIIINRESFSGRLKLLRGGRSKAEFARELGVSAPVYQNYEAGRIPNPDKLLLIAARLNRTVGWLLGADETTAEIPGGTARRSKVMIKEKGKPVLHEHVHYEANPLDRNDVMAQAQARLKTVEMLWMQMPDFADKDPEHYRWLIKSISETLEEYAKFLESKKEKPS